MLQVRVFDVGTLPPKNPSCPRLGRYGARRNLVQSEALRCMSVAADWAVEWRKWSLPGAKAEARDGE